MIHFVGAGPGAADLVTLRGARLLSLADAVIYTGSLVNPELLSMARPDCEIFDSAKMTLEEVARELTRVHNEGKTAVRLHTGDPSLYGAVREQMDVLCSAGIPYDVTPGVSSFCAAAAALRAEYTLPDVSQSVVITRAAGRTPVPERESVASFASHGATMVIFLSAGMARTLQNELLSGGYPQSTPAAIVYRASWPEEKIVLCTVGTLAESAERSGIANHALITVGDFLGGDYSRSKLYDPDFTTAFRAGAQT